jgi:hypothetical protein
MALMRARVWKRYFAIRRGRRSASRVISLFIRVSALCELL